jgi:hypothetical protein
LSALIARNRPVVAALVCAIVAAAFACPPGPRAGDVHAQDPLSPVTGLEVVGELRPGTPNIPLLLVVQWNPVDLAEGYELERAEPGASAAEHVWVPLAEIPADAARLRGKVWFVDDAGFAGAGGDCYRVRATRGDEVSDWAETCVPVPPASGGPPSPDTLDFTVEFTPDWEFTILRWDAVPGFMGPFTVTDNFGLTRLATIPARASPGRITLTLPRRGGCFRLEMAGLAPIERVCGGPPTDLMPPALLDANALTAPVVVRLTGREEAPVVVRWTADGWPLEVAFRIERVGDPGSGEVATVSYAAASVYGFESKTLMFLDSEPATEKPCYRVTAISYVSESLVGQACLADAPAHRTRARAPLPTARRVALRWRSCFSPWRCWPLRCKRVPNGAGSVSDRFLKPRPFD